MILAPLIHFDDVVGLLCRFDFERVGRQFYLHAVGAELGDGAWVALLAGDGELEVIHTGQALTALSIADKADALERHIAIEQFQIEFCTVLLDPFQGLSRNPWLCHSQAPAVASNISTERLPRVNIC